MFGLDFRCLSRILFALALRFPTVVARGAFVSHGTIRCSKRLTDEIWRASSADWVWRRWVVAGGAAGVRAGGAGAGVHVGGGERPPGVPGGMARWAHGARSGA